MPWLVALTVLALLTWWLGFSIYRSNELFRLELRAGELRLRRGRIPPSLLADFRDVLRRTTARRAQIRAVSADGMARLETRGKLSADELQRLRNLLGTHSLAKLRAGRRAR